MPIVMYPFMYPLKWCIAASFPPKLIPTVQLAIELTPSPRAPDMHIWVSITHITLLRSPPGDESFHKKY